MSALELDAVAKRYTTGGEVVCAVDGASLTIAPGEVVALYGPSGSGKTTLLELAAGTQRPDHGSVRFGGVDLATLSAGEAARYRRSLGFVFQRFYLHPGTSALDNAAMKLLFAGWAPRRAKQQALTWLRRVGLEQRAGHPPSKLSMGEQQRVVIARALAGEPALILADEPTASLDTERGRAILSLLAGICRERRVGMLLATHDPDAAAFADRVCDLRDGLLTERADHRPAAAPAPART
ncbi:ABC transporter ATP-binding protein [Conexibacter stalactiti]|uniref:ABC transporter ATP-binding protein n=1 Tax=Conexibacter stalactiti TaxID=1940611 RepID=A0ABU4HVY5_9ACTN|nr:ABC transporter ATP-binding protein [Conexibacter stalactiti]MDW5597492.1 ABC transporter ATP-binding protein [Conexibacter stalactiti]MEC5038134.1 ABC transporter ATP-binding protein [Conexibacter stalactiti]